MAPRYQEEMFGTSLPASYDGSTVDSYKQQPETDAAVAEQATVAAYEQFGPALLGYASQLAGNQDVARDAVQEVFLRYFVERRYGRTIESPRAWLYQVLRNYLLDRLKAAPTQLECQADLETVAAARQKTPEELVQRTQSAHEIAASLSDREFTCLTLRGEGLSYSEIATVMSIRIGTVGALLARAQTKLRRYERQGKTNTVRAIAEALVYLVQEAARHSTS